MDYEAIDRAASRCVLERLGGGVGRGGFHERLYVAGHPERSGEEPILTSDPGEAKTFRDATDATLWREREMHWSLRKYYEIVPAIGLPGRSRA